MSDYLDGSTFGHDGKLFYILTEVPVSTREFPDSTHMFPSLPVSVSGSFTSASGPPVTEFGLPFETGTLCYLKRDDLKFVQTLVTEKIRKGKEGKLYR